MMVSSSLKHCNFFGSNFGHTSVHIVQEEECVCGYGTAIPVVVAY